MQCAHAQHFARTRLRVDGLEEFHRRQNDNMPFNELNGELLEVDANGKK